MIPPAITSAMVVRCFKTFWCNAQVLGASEDVEASRLDASSGWELGDF
jgi:hypothetical protein